MVSASFTKEVLLLPTTLLDIALISFSLIPPCILPVAGVRKPPPQPTHAG